MTIPAADGGDDSVHPETWTRPQLNVDDIAERLEHIRDARTAVAELVVWLAAAPFSVLARDDNVQRQLRQLSDEIGSAAGRLAGAVVAGLEGGSAP